ncbi:MAG: pentapeptide repeat-containing protein, partial [Marinomonas sp.]
MLSGLAELAVSALAIASPGAAAGDTAALTDEQRQKISVCAQGDETLDAMIARPAIVNATGMTKAAQLEAAIKQAKGERLIILGGEFAGEDMRNIAPLLAGACVHGSNFSSTNWDNIVMSSVQFDNIVMDGVSAKGASWTDMSMRGVSFPKGDFTGADLAQLKFTSAYTGADFDEVSFRGANLTEARFECGITVTYWCLNASPDLSDAILKGADVTSFWFGDASKLQGTGFDQTVAAPRVLPDLDPAMVKGPLVLKAAYAFEFEDFSPATATLSQTEARSLIAAAKEGAADHTKDEPSFDCAKAE